MRRLTLLALTLLAPLAAHSQILAVYGTFSPLNASNVATGSALVSVSGSGGTASTYQEQYTSFFTPAFGGGITFGILSVGPVHVGFDVRGSTKPGTTGADTALGGIKIQLKPPFLPLKPYIQVSAGYLATRTYNLTNYSSTGSTTTVSSTIASNGQTFTNKYLLYQGIAGLDYRFGHFIDLRVIELGFGQGLDILGSANSNATVFTLNTGIVLHF